MSANPTPQFLVRFSGTEPHAIAHHTHTVGEAVGARCSAKAEPAVRDWSQKGRWRLVKKLPDNVRLCKNCVNIATRQANPLPARVERELEMLAKWDKRAAELQRERLLKQYQNKKRK